MMNGRRRVGAGIARRRAACGVIGPGLVETLAPAALEDDVKPLAGRSGAPL